MTDEVTADDHSPGRHMVVGSAWMIGLRWATRLIGVFSTILLARLLTPADFGIVAMAMFFVGMIEILNQSGQKLAIVRLREPTRADYDTCWTLSVLIGLCVAGIIVTIAPIAAYYFHDRRVIPVMDCLALRSFIGGFENIGVMDFRRDLHFHRQFVYNIIPKVFSFVITIFFAFSIGTYWSLVIGILAFSVVSNVLSYAMHPYRPRLGLTKIREIGSFSGWTFFKAVAWYLNGQIDQFAVGGIGGAASMGRYAVAEDVASSPSKELNEPVILVLYPVMSKYQRDTRRLRELYLQVLGWSAIICSSTSVGVALVSPDFANVILGPKWTDIVPLMGWLALSAGMLGLSSGAYTTFDALGLPQLGARMQWVRLVMLLLAIGPVAYLTRNLELIAITRFIVTLVFMPTLFFAVGRAVKVSIRDYYLTFWRPLTASLSMAACVTILNLTAPFSGLARLLVDSALGSLIFVGSLLWLWQISGRPSSPEESIVEFLRSLSWRRVEPFQ